MREVGENAKERRRSPEHETRRRFCANVSAAWMLASLCTHAAPALADGTPFFSSAQIAQGRWEYSQKCAVCHGAQLQGTGAPALKGRIFNTQWNGKKLSDLYSCVHTNMPLGLANSLPSQEYADIVAYILAQSGLPAGDEKLTPRSSMDRVLELSADANVGRVIFTGDLLGNFLALNARNGKTLYRFNTGGPVAGGVITYESKGKQYVAAASGSSGGSIPLTGSTTIVIFGQ